MPAEVGPPSDLKLDEVRMVIASLFQVDATEIEDWLIITKRRCGSCGISYCDKGLIATIGSRAGISDNGDYYHEMPFELHLAARFIDSLADRWKEEREAEGR